MPPPYLVSNQKTNSATQEANVAAKLYFHEGFAITAFLKKHGIVDMRGRLHKDSRPKHHQQVGKDIQMGAVVAKRFPTVAALDN